MASTAKKISITVVLLLLVVAGGLFYLGSNLNGIVAGVIETQGSKVVGTSVRVSGVDIRLTEAAAGLSGLRIANPPEFSGNAMELGNFSVKLDASSLTKETIVVNNVTVDGARINVVQAASGNNLQTLLANMQSESAGEASSSDASSKKIIIDEFTLSGASASVSIPQLDQTREVALPLIVVKNIGRSTNGATAAQVARQILKPVIDKAIASATAGAIKEAAGEKINNAVGGLLKGLTGGDGKKE